MEKLVYRGSNKHKNRPTLGRKGTLCPEWTHWVGELGYGGDPFTHYWPRTQAHEMLVESEIDPNTSGKRWATRNGIAFVAHPTNDGTWHGYPEPWNKVPAVLVEKWRAAGKVTRRDLRRYTEAADEDRHWALESDLG